MAINIKQKILNAKTYFFAAASVSKPIAFFMAFFGLSFVVSLLVGVFLLGQWGYERVVEVERPEVISSEPSTQAQNDTSQNNTNTTTENPENPKAIVSVVPSNTNTATSNNRLPDTGTSPLLFLYIALVGAMLHHAFQRVKK